MRARIAPAPSRDVAAAIFGALRHPAGTADVRRDSPRVSAWHRASLHDAVGDGAPWEPSA